MTQQSAQTDSQTLLSLLQQFTAYDALPDAYPQTLHLFASAASEPPTALLRDLITASHVLTNSLTIYHGFPISDARVTSLLRQHGSLTHDIHFYAQEARKRIDILRKQAGKNYGEDVPLDREAIVPWCISRLEQWGRSAGMEIFKDEREGHTSIVLGGKVLVIDIDFVVEKSATSAPLLNVANVKTSHAIPSGTSGNTLTDRSVSLDGFIRDRLRCYLKEVQSPNNLQDTLKAARIAKEIEGHLIYLMKLDNLAHQEGDSGIRWFNDVGTLCSTMEQAAKLETVAVANSLSAPSAPLDIFLLRAHAYPLPYLLVPSIAFLTYLSPLAYLSLLNASKSENSGVGALPGLDVSESVLRNCMPCKETRPPGAIIATLSLAPSRQIHSDSQHIQSLSTRPTFPLPTSTPLADLNHSFPQVPPPSSGSAPRQEMWMLDFTDGGATAGIVVSQARMRDVQLVVNPLSVVNDMGVELMSFGYGSWVDLLLSTNIRASERYTCLYTSPSSAHPPLRLRLASPIEPGFVLGRVHVRNLKEVWGILEVVREQCWLNETLKSCAWVPEDLKAQDDAENDGEVTEEDLKAILDGTFKTRSIPVNVYLPYQAPTDSLFDTGDDLDALSLPPRSAPPRILMTVETRDASPSQLQITVSHDQMRPRGIRVDVNGSLPFTTQQVERLEETARRGGTLGLAGKLWSWNLS